MICSILLGCPNILYLPIISKCSSSYIYTWLYTTTIWHWFHTPLVCHWLYETWCYWNYYPFKEIYATDYDYKNYVTHRLATDWTVRDRNLVGGENFRTCPDRPWRLPSLLYNGYRVFPGGKERPGPDADPSPPSSAVVKKE